jgi:hypothetical protein
MSEEETPRDVEAEHIVRVRAGHGANCSSIGSVIDTLFATAVIGSAIFAAVAAALATEPVRVVEPKKSDAAPREVEP